MNRILISKEIGMKCCIHDMYVFTLFDDETNERVIVVLWVDDIIITGNSIYMVECIISHIESNVTKIISNLGEITRYIGKRHGQSYLRAHSSSIHKVGPNLKATNVFREA